MKGIWLISTIKAVLVARPVTAAAQSHILRAKTCNETFAGTTDTLTLSFCAGGSNCITGSGNAYNLYDELMPDGTWNNLTVPVEYNPTDMVAEIAGSDAWCIEQLVWDDGPNLLGRGGRVYLDHDTGIDGCSYGVHHQTGGFYPCKQQWRFFNLQGADDFKYEVAVKSCGNGGSSRVKASLCSESMCNEEAGELVTFDLEVNGKNKKWIKKHVSVNFNPVAMKLTGAGKPWCVEDMVVNGFRIRDLTGGPRFEMSGNPIEEQYFYNVQREDVKDLTSDSSGGEDSFAQTGWMVLTEVIIAVTAGLVLYATVGGSSFLSKKVLSCLSPRTTEENLDNDDERPLCEECRHRRDTPLCPSTATGTPSGTGSLIRYSEQEMTGSANELGNIQGLSPSGKSCFYLGKPTLKRCQKERLLQTRTLSSKSLDGNEESPPGWKSGDSPRSTGGNLSKEMTRNHLWPLSSPVLERVDTSHLWSNGEVKGAPGGNEPSQHKLSERAQQTSGEDIWDNCTESLYSSG